VSSFLSTPIYHWIPDTKWQTF